MEGKDIGEGHFNEPTLQVAGLEREREILLAGAFPDKALCFLPVIT